MRPGRPGGGAASLASRSRSPRPTNAPTTSEAPALREAAQHVAKFNLTQAKTREYVTALLADGGRRRQVRLTPTGLETRVRKLRESLDGVTVLRRVASLEMDGSQKQRLASEVRRLKELLTKVEHALR